MDKKSDNFTFGCAVYVALFIATAIALNSFSEQSTGYLVFQWVLMGLVAIPLAGWVMTLIFGAFFVAKTAIDTSRGSQNRESRDPLYHQWAEGTSIFGESNLGTWTRGVEIDEHGNETWSRPHPDFETFEEWKARRAGYGKEYRAYHDKASFDDELSADEEE
ncbi:MAG: hypothetical protein L6Q71_05725 [Planctomycetes bacterium]|nr:hypothetical protein [Planctomycetota bacterium]NUQ33989.1 hypothetical protein [Planctomycetaceae bacterium]